MTKLSTPISSIIQICENPKFLHWKFQISGEISLFSLILRLLLFKKHYFSILLGEVFLSTWECYTRNEEKCGLLNFSTRALAVVVKTNSSTRGCAACGKFVFTTPAKPLVGNWECAIRDSWGICFSRIRGFATHVGKTHPYFSPDRNWLIPI